ncbi:ATP-binding cassette domain-containing protein [Parachlamydia sp. AcF125]|uniref:ABC transporter ATP-binding protein n=1 Tax=Parachlamydia sp. AcF125 TaxID=2795736 RepID=UPI001BC9DA1A|nr:ATP-binding cassette domain-containing protein [Parachlamydia sp. AcF125]MBS4169051.1 putative ribonucleotide transport ATP-binding protein mkl [Parachlamydia sp. AcF125]
MRKQIVIKELYKKYGKLEVLKGLDLEVYEGETLVILGRSGVGKSVLLKHIIGLEQPDRGSIEIDGVSIAYLEKSNTSFRIGMLFQGAALFDSLNIGENTAFYLNQHEKNLSKKQIQERVSHALNLVGLSGTENAMPSDLSGGMRKRAALARLIVYHPKIILYDEPTTGLDPITAMQINDLINTAKKELKATSIVVTHDIRSALEVGDRLAFHHEGKIAQIAPKEEFMKIDDPLLQAFFENAILTNDLLSGKQTRRP